MKSKSEDKSWDKYWSSSNINREIMKVWGAYFVRTYEEIFGFKETDVILDFGAGYGDVSYFLKDKVKHIYLYDKSEYMLGSLNQNFNKFDHIEIINSIRQINKDIDIIIVNSVLQYMKPKELITVLKELKTLCNKNTMVIISDIIPNNYSKVSDFLTQLKLGLKYGFFLKLIIYAFSNILFCPLLSLSKSYLNTYDEAEIKSILDAEHFISDKMKSNFTLSKKRYTLVCRLNPN